MMMKSAFAAAMVTVLCCLSVNVFAKYEASAIPEGDSGGGAQILYVWAHYDTWQSTRVALVNGFSYLEPQGSNGELAMPQKSPSGVNISYLEALAPVPAEDKPIGNVRKGIYGMDILLMDDTKYSYLFCEKGIYIAKALPGEVRGKAAPYLVDAAAYQTLLVSLEEAAKKEPAYPLWLTGLRKTRIESVELNVRGSRKGYVATDFPLDILQLIAVEKQAPTAIYGAQPPKGGDQVTVFRLNGSKLTLAVTDCTITIYSSDMSYALRYQCAKGERSLLDRLEQAAKGDAAPLEKYFPD